MKKNIIISLVIAAIIIAASFYLSQRNEKSAVQDESDPFLSWDGSWKTYHSDTHGFSLEYPGYLSFDDSKKETIFFGTKEENGEISPHNGGMAIIIEKTDILSAQDWFHKNKDRSAPHGMLLLEREFTVNGHSVILTRWAETAQDGEISPTPDQGMVVVKDGILITINGAGIDFERVMGGLKFN